MTAAELLAKHGIKPESTAPGRHYTTCPKCSAGRASKEHRAAKVLGVTIENDGGVHWGCNHCSWTGPEKGDGERSGEPKLKTYDYQDDDGALSFQKVRNPPGSQARFYCRRPDGNGRWINSLKGIDRKPLYRWPEIRKAMEQGHTIAIVEGEKDADNLWSLDIPATCNFDGAADVVKSPKAKPKWRAEYSEQLAGADLVVFNDNDAPGFAHADGVCRLSHGLARRVRRLDLAPHWSSMPKGADVSDWLALGHTRQELEALIKQAPDYQPAVQDKPPPESTPTGNGTDETDVEISRLAKLTPVQFERERKSAAEKLNVRTSILDKLVQAEREKLGLDDDGGKQGRAVAFPEPEPWPEPIEGPALLDQLAEAIGKHVVMAEYSRHVAALWAVHTYLLDAFTISPRLAVRSPMRRCGKSTLFSVLGRLIFRPQSTESVTAAAVFRIIEAYRPALLVDEADTFLHDNDELRGVLNSGHRKGGAVLRTVGDDHEPRAFSTYSALAIALIGKLPDTLHDRSVVIDLKRRLASESIESFRDDRAGHLDVLARKVARWAKDNAERVAAADPKMPDGIYNREADNWRTLLAIADTADGHWPERARKAVQLAHAAGDDDDQSRLELLLSDIRDTFKADEMASAELVTALVAIEGRPWAELGKSRKPLTQNGLARMLKGTGLGIAPKHIGPKKNRVRGYVRSEFEEAFRRYLPPKKPDGVSQPFTRSQCDEIRTSGISQPFTPEPGCTVEECEKPNNDGLVNGCTVAKGESEESEHAAPTNGQAGIPFMVTRQMREGLRMLGLADEDIAQLTPAEAHALLDKDDGLEMPEFLRRPLPVSARIRKLSDEPLDGVACMQCRKSDGEVFRIKDAAQNGGKPEPLHEACAADWFRATS